MLSIFFFLKKKNWSSTKYGNTLQTNDGDWQLICHKFYNSIDY
jgi:hypothetical protein